MANVTTLQVANFSLNADITYVQAAKRLGVTGVHVYYLARETVRVFGDVRRNTERYDLAMALNK